jgi:hypothetical protein
MGEPLPQITRPIQKPAFIDKEYFSNKEFNEFKNTLQEMIEGSCMAFAINNETIWNCYGEMSIATKINENMVREYVCKNIHVILNDIVYDQKSTQFYIYMFERNPILIIVFYDSDDESFLFKYFK